MFFLWTSAEGCRALQANRMASHLKMRFSILNTFFTTTYTQTRPHTHIQHTWQHTHTHHIHVTYTDTSLHIHTHPLGEFSLTTGPLPCCWLSPSPAPQVRSPSLAPGVRVRYRGSYQGHVPPLNSRGAPWTSWGDVLSCL